jgi:hypothetical protein
MTTIARVVLVAALASGSGCATPPDWIQRTLVTVDVTGHWHGATLAGSGTSFRPEVWLDLQQEGPKVRGFIVWRDFEGLRFRRSNSPGSIEGTISGDVFSFKQTDGPGRGELTVRGDDMTGQVSIGPSVLMTLRRNESSPRPDSTKP